MAKTNFNSWSIIWCVAFLLAFNFNKWKGTLWYVARYTAIIIYPSNTLKIYSAIFPNGKVNFFFVYVTDNWQVQTIPGIILVQIVAFPIKNYKMFRSIWLVVVCLLCLRINYMHFQSIVWQIYLWRTITLFATKEQQEEQKLLIRTRNFIDVQIRIHSKIFLKKCGKEIKGEVRQNNQNFGSYFNFIEHRLHLSVFGYFVTTKFG